FKSEMEKAPFNFEIFDQAGEYERAKTLVFGGIGREEFKLLNRAMNVKKIDQIDSFIRKYMLRDPEAEAVSLLIDKVERAQIIAHDLNLFEKKVKAATEIVQNLSGLEAIEKEQLEKNNK